MITTNALVPVGRIVAVEGAYRHIQCSIVQVGIQQYHLIGMGTLEILLHWTGIYKHAIVQIALVHHPHVCQTQYNDEQSHGQSLQLAIVVQNHQQCSYSNNPERAHGIGCEHQSTHIAEILHQAVHKLLVNITGLHQTLDTVCLACGNIVAKECIGHKPEQETDATCDHKTQPQGIHGLIYKRYTHVYARWVFYKLLQCHHGHEGYGEFSYHQNRCHGTELVIHGHIVQEEICQSHEVLTPGKGYGQHRCQQQGPAYRSTHNKQAQHKQHAHECTHIHRSAGTRLLTPILSQLVV